MKITFISRYQGEVERGVENYVKELALRLKSLGNEVEILTSAWQLLGNQKRPGLPVGERPGLKIIYPLNGYWQSFGCRIYSWVTGSKLVLGGHAGIGRDDRWNLYMFPDLFIAFSQKGFDWAKKVNPLIKIVKITHGVDLKKFSPDIKALELDLERPRFVTAANLVSYKRVEETVKAVAKLKKGSLLILGDGPLEKKIDEIGNKLLNGLSSRSASWRSGDLTDNEIAASQTPRNDCRQKRYLRLKVPHGEMPRYLNSCDVFTLVSEESEAFGLVYLEAMACNLPVVATDDSLRRELVGEAGVFVNRSENSLEYAVALELAVETNWGDKPLNQAKKFDWEKIADRYLEGLLNIIVQQHKI
jgi:glycosyltransferase involved in cell wall biosynthesis